MVIRRLTPAHRLQKLIKCYYYLERDDDRTLYDTYFADGCVEVCFSTGWDFYKDGNKEDRAKIIGQIIKPRALEIRGKGKSFGIWFYPHAFSYFLRMNLDELNDRVVAWDQLFPRSVSEFVDNCLHDGQLGRLAQGMDRFWLNRLSSHKEKQADQLLEFCVDYLYQRKATADLDELSSTLSVSQRYLQKMFVSKIGFSQKHLLRILRFQNVMRQLPDYTSSLTQLAYEHHFYDQSHFIREFKSFTGFSPSNFDAQQLPINQHFLSVD